MDIQASDWNGTNGRGFSRITNCGTTKYDLGGNSRGTHKARNRPCKFFYCRRKNLSRFSHHYQKPDNHNNYKADAHTERMDGRVNVAPGGEDSNWSGTVSGLDIAAASSQYDPLTDSLDLIKSIISEQEALAQYDPVTDSLDLIKAIISEEEALPQYDPVTDSLYLIKAIISEEEAKMARVIKAMHGTDCKDVDLMAVNVERHQSSEKEQFFDCKDENQNILKGKEVAERKDGSEVANTEGDVKTEERKGITDG